MARKTEAKRAGEGAVWAIARSHAYTVLPQRTAGSDATPVGGILALDEQLRVVLSSILLKLEEQKYTPIELELDETSRTSPVRDRILEYSFGAGGQISRAGFDFASNLSNVMDTRSNPSLLLLILERHVEDDSRRRMNLLLFPRDRSFQLESNGKDAREAILKVLDNTFSTGSTLRKVARFDGKNVKTHFLSGSVVDNQAASSVRTIADFWIAGFLHAKFRLNSSRGTLLLAQGLREAIAATPSGEKNEGVPALMFALSTQKTTWSLDEFAKKHLPPSVQPAFLKVVPNEDTRHALFDLDKEILREKLAFRIFELPGGVFVSAPLEQVGQPHQLGKHVTVEDGDGFRFLSCSGRIVNEKVAATQARPRSRQTSVSGSTSTP